MTECYPIYIPFWSTTTRVAGWICGYEERTHSDGKRTYTERIPKEEMVLRDYRFSEIACDPGDLGIRKLRNMDGETTLTDFQMIPTFESTTSRDDATDACQGERDGERPVRCPRASHHVRERACLPEVDVHDLLSGLGGPLHLPRQDVPEHGGRRHRNGPFREGLPGDPLFQSLAVTAGTSIGGLLAAAGVIVASSSAEVAVGCFIVGLIIMIGTYLFFRHGSEITEGEFSDRGFRLGDLKGVASQLSQGRVGGNNWGDI